jgi:hypothetical protein
VSKKEWPRRWLHTPEPGPQKGWHATVDRTESSAPHTHPSTDHHDDTVEAHYSGLERLHACYEGVVYIGHLVEDPGTGDETEVIEAVPCRRCTDSR